MSELVLALDQPGSPKEMISSLRKEMNLIKAEEMFLKKQILSLNDQFQDLMLSVSKHYPDILNEDFAQKSNKSILHVIEIDSTPKQPLYESESLEFKTDKAKSPENVSPTRTERRSRWNEWRESRGKRRTFIEGEIESKERHDQSQLDSPRRPTSLHVNSITMVTPESDYRGVRSHRSRSEPRPESSSSPDDGRFALDSERRRRIRQRLKESRKTLDVVHLGLF